MVVHSTNNLLMCLTFSYSLKGVARIGFTLCRPHSLHNFEEVTKYASHQEAKKNNHHILTIKMRWGNSLKSYIDYFQSKLFKVFHCSEDISTLIFISGLQISHPMYRHLLKQVSPILRSALHPVGGSDEELLQPFRQMQRRRRKV